MGTSLTGTKIRDTYDALIKVSDNGALDGTLQVLTDGLGNNSALSLSTAGASVGGTLAVSGISTLTGSVGIGGAASGTYGKLTVFGGMRTADDSSSKLEIGRYSAGAPNSYIKMGANSQSLRVTDHNDQFDLFTIYNTGDISFRDSSANEAFYWDASAASLGIGGVPSQKLEVVGNVLVKNSLGNAIAFTAAEADNSGTFYMYNNGSLTNVISTNGNSYFNAGNVGIGVTPSQKLHLYNSGTDTYLRVDRGAIQSLFGTDNIGTYIGQQGAYDMRFITNAAERMRIDSSGNVLIGATSPVSTRRELRIGGNDGGSRISLGLQGNNASALYVDSGYNLVLANEYNDAAIKVLVINYNNGVYLSQSATSWTANSDERLKNINGSIDGALEKLNTLRAVNFSWKDDDSQKENLGLIAQDVEQVFPQVIDRNKKISKDEVEVDETEYLGVRYTELIPVLIAAIQELNAKVESLEAQLNA